MSDGRATNELVKSTLPMYLELLVQCRENSEVLRQGSF